MISSTVISIISSNICWSDEVKHLEKFKLLHQIFVFCVSGAAAAPLNFHFEYQEVSTSAASATNANSTY